VGRPTRPERELDTLEDRFLMAPAGLHALSVPATAEQLAKASLGDAAALWARWDGIEYCGGESRIHSLDDITAESTQALEEERISTKERVIGHSGKDQLVLAEDPWEAGAEVWLIEEDGTRHPFASSVPRLAAMLLGDSRVMLDDEGEYRDEIFGDHGGLTEQAERRLQRRRLDHDDDSPYARYRLAQLLRVAGELSGARRELELTLKRAPNYLWAHLEHGRCSAALGDSESARASFAEVARLAQDDGLRAFALAWQAIHSDAEERRRLATQVDQLYPGFALAQEHGARAALEAEDLRTAQERIQLGLAVEPGHLGLLALRGQLSSNDSSG
jgi:hypothetical protein